MALPWRLRPFPGGTVDETVADALTGKLFGFIPASLVALVAIVLIVGFHSAARSLAARLMRWAHRSQRRTCPEFQSSGPNLWPIPCRACLAGIGGLFLTFFTYTGEAAYASGNAYTLFSIAAVVLGGVSLFGGKGSAIGAIFGALAFRTIGDLLFVFDFDPSLATAVPGCCITPCRQSWRFWPASYSQPFGLVWMNALTSRLPAFMRRVDPAVTTAFACILLLLFVGSLYSQQFPVS